VRFLLSVGVALVLPMPALADDWWEAETSHFVVLSESSEREARELAVKLERFDEALRFLQNKPAETAPVPRSAKLTLHHFGTTADIGYLLLGRPNSVAGFFVPRAGNSVAFVPRKDESVSSRNSSIVRPDEYTSMDPQSVLFHEYAHYFMYQHAPAAYPAWYSEGSAEVYGTLQLAADGFRLGEPALHRQTTLKYLRGYSLKRLLDRTDKFTGQDGAQVYALGWLLSHYLTFDPERQGQLGKFLALVNDGVPGGEAGEQAFGDLEKLERDLAKYGTGRMPVIDVRRDDYSAPTATVRQLREDEVARMPLAMRLARGLDDEDEQKEARSLVGDARALESRFPVSVPVLLVAAEIEFEAKNDARAEQVARRILELDGNNSRAHLLLGRVALRQGEADPSKFAEARRSFATVSRLDPNRPEAFFGYYQSFLKASETPPDDARLALERAYESARFDSEIRVTLAHLYLMEDRDGEAVALLGPIINDPHGGKPAERLRSAVELIASGSTDEALGALATFDPEEKDDEED